MPCLDAQSWTVRLFMGEHEQSHSCVPSRPDRYRETCLGNDSYIVGQVSSYRTLQLPPPLLPCSRGSQSHRRQRLWHTITLEDACLGGGRALKPRALPHLLLCSLHSALSYPSADSPAPGSPMQAHRQSIPHSSRRQRVRKCL
jgi:hypothetical protein